MKRWLGERRDVLGLDTETTGLNPYAPDAKLRTVQIGDHRAGWFVPFEMWGGAVMECLNAWDGPIAVHNLAFDEKWLRIHAGWKVPWDRMHDTMIHYNLMYPGAPAGLKNVTDKHIDPRASIGADMLKKAFAENKWDWATVPLDYPAFSMYGALDPVLAAYIWEFLRADKKYPASFDLEMNTLRICSAMEDRGVPVDVDYCLQKQIELEEYVEGNKKWALAEKGINIGSTLQLAKYFEGELNAVITKRTAGGQPSMDKDVLEGFSSNSDPKVAQFAQFVLNVRKAEKIKSAYIDNFIARQTDGILHSNIKTLRAVTGRMSITDPALQTLGKSDTIVRNAIIPREGHKIVSCDLDQVEFRVFAHLSQDDALIKTFFTADETGTDVFTLIGRQIYGPDFQKSDKRRTYVKNVVYGKLYGSGVAKMAQAAGVAREVMQEVNDGLESAFPGIKGYQKQMEGAINYRLKTEGKAYIKTVVTEREIPVEEERLYSGLNYTIQSSAAEVFKTNLCKIDAAGLDEFMMVPVHDEIVLSVPDDIAEDVMHEVQKHMTTTEGWSVPLTAGADGPYKRWGEKYDG